MNIRANFTRNSIIFMLISIALTTTVHYALKGYTDGWQVIVMLLTGIVSSSLVAILCGPWAGAFTGMVYGLISFSIDFFDWQDIPGLTVVFWLVGILAHIGIFRTWWTAVGSGFLMGLFTGMIGLGFVTGLFIGIIAILLFFMLLHLSLPWNNIWKSMPQAPYIFSEGTNNIKKSESDENITDSHQKNDQILKTKTNLNKFLGYLGVIGIVLFILIMVGYILFLLIWAIGVGAL